MTIYKRQSDGLLMIGVRSERRVGLRELTLALYHSNETLGKDLSVRRVRRAVSDELDYFGSNLFTKVADYIHESRGFDEGSAVGRDIDARLEWARRMVMKAYGGEFAKHPESLAALREFEALPVDKIA